MPKKHLTQQFIQSSLSMPSTTNKIDYFDTKVSGLVLKVLKSGRYTFYIRFTDKRGNKREKKIGCASALSLTDAREMVQDLRVALAKGEDPFEGKEKLKEVPLFRDFVVESYLPYIKGYKRSWKTDVCLLNNHVLPALGDLYMDEIKHQHIMKLTTTHRSTHQPASTNRIIILCRFIFNCALRWNVPCLEVNPTLGVDMYPENNKLETFLTKKEAYRLYQALQESESKMLKYIIPMLLLTGARRGEVLNARWKEFDLENKIWYVEFNKTGKPRHIPLSEGTLQLLASVPRLAGCEHVFPNMDTGKPYVHIFTSWKTARNKAGLPGLRIHDLRHSFASFLINKGRSLYEVQKILGHTQVSTTQRYAHLSQDSLMSAANCMNDVMVMPQQLKDIPLIEAQ